MAKILLLLNEDSVPPTAPGEGNVVGQRRSEEVVGQGSSEEGRSRLRASGAY